MVSFPWETLSQIYSYCDQPTLVALCLASFGSWQTAGPLLYEEIEVTSLDQLKSLFYLDIRDEHGSGTAFSIRGQASLLHRIRSLTLNIQSVEQSDMQPRLEISKSVTWKAESVIGLDSFDPDDEGYTGPRRLVRAGQWDLPALTVLGAGYPASWEIDDPIWDNYPVEDRLLSFYATQLFPRLNPVRFTLRWPHAFQWRFLELPLAQLAFIEGWSALARIEMDGWCITGSLVNNPYELPKVWGTVPAMRSGGSRALEIVFDFSTREAPFDEILWAPDVDPIELWQVMLFAGVTRQAMGSMNLKVLLKVRVGDEASVKQRVDNLEESWLTEIIVIEAAQEE